MRLKIRELGESFAFATSGVRLKPHELTGMEACPTEVFAGRYPYPPNLWVNHSIGRYGYLPYIWGLAVKSTT